VDQDDDDESQEVQRMADKRRTPASFRFFNATDEYELEFALLYSIMIQRAVHSRKA
jgi:hypothetical protein